MENRLTALIEKRKKFLFYYSPYNYLKAIDPEIQFRILVEDKILRFGTTPDQVMYQIMVNEQTFIFLYQHLEWDSNFLKRNCFKLYTVLYSGEDAPSLIAAIQHFIKHMADNSGLYLFIDIPAEDVFLIQCLGYAGFKLTETRLHYFKDNLHSFNAERYAVRKASVEEAEAIAQISKLNRNGYDRLHADIDFPNEVADEYLGVYGASAVKGYCEAVLVPDESGAPLQSFLAISHLKRDSSLVQCQLARVVLTAVAPANKGWLKKLVSETIYYAKDIGAAYVLMTTQSTNRAVFRTNEKLGLQLGGCSHILSFSNQ
ncbi:MAG: hypothetical protein ICV84_18955 [Flavisolibacter sp.]|nr:hypothetical protein [Flavisolibacter sp.]